MTLTAVILVTLLFPAFPNVHAPVDSPQADDGKRDPAPGNNLAPFATPTTSFVSGHERLAAINDDIEPQGIRDHSHGCYGNWPRTGTQWVQYEWSRPISTDRVGVYWWDDSRGVRLPTACRLSYWDGNAFVPVQEATGLGVAGGQWNTTTFCEVETLKLRLEFDGRGDFSTGIIEWKVYDSGASPAFPPSVTAGIDRTVVLPACTYLNGSVRGPAESIMWSKVSGPGEVTFSDSRTTTTSATFSKPGDYVLRLTGENEDLEASSTLAVKVIAPPPKTPLGLVDTKPYRVDSPLWNHRVKALIAHWIPHCIEKISDPGLKEGGINNFVDAANKLAGKPHGQHRGYVFSNAWVYNTIESICVALMIDPQGDQEIIRAQAAMQRTLEDWIPKILAAQEEDGYLQTYFTLGDRPRWSPRLRSAHEGYVAGYFLEAAISHYLLTGKRDRRLYDAAKKLADCWCTNIGPPPKQPWYDGHQAMEMALVRFGRFVNTVEGNGQGDKYVELAKFLLDNRDDGSEYDQSHVPVIKQYEAVGHAVRASYSYAGMADVAMETGDRDYQSAVMSLWDNIVNRKYYVTGGIGSGETSEGFGPDYSLRHNAYCESCSSCGEILFQHKLHLTHRDAKYADLYEETLYNALLGSIDLAGENFYYQNPLDCNHARYDWHGCPCCVGNIPRTLLMLPTWTYSTSEDGVWVNLFVGSAVTVEDVAGTDVELVQETDYPWSGEVSITVNPAEAKEFAFRIRLPNRSVSELYSSEPGSDGIASIRVNGERVDPPESKGYAVVRRTWKPGDRIELTLPMKLQRITGIDKVEATRGQVALRYGPLIYCVENVDQDIDKALPREDSLQTEWRGDLLGGVQVITGEWADGSPFLAIPYYARQNRPGKAETGRRGVRSSVWIGQRQASAVTTSTIHRATITAVADVRVETVVGRLPRLPLTIPAKYQDGREGPDVRVIWPAPKDNAQVLEAGTYTIVGSIPGTNLQPEAIVQVLPSSERVPPTPARSLQAFSLRDVTLNKDEQGRDTPFIKNRDKFLDGLAATRAESFLYMFRDAFGQQQPEGARPLGVWDSQTTRLRGHASGHYISALAQASAGCDDDESLRANLKRKMDDMVDTLYNLSRKSGTPREPGGECNADPATVPPGPGRDGYTSDLSKDGIRTDYWNWGQGFISAYPPDQFIMLEQGATYGGRNDQIWAPYYTLHKILAGLLDCYEIGGNEKALQVAQDMGLWVHQRLRHVPTETRIRMWNRYIAGEFGGMNDVMARLYRITDDERFLQCAQMFDNTEFFFGDADHRHGLACNVDTIRGRHANQHIPQVTGALAIYRCTGDPPYYAVAENFWHICRGSYMYAIGGVAGACNPKNPECFTAQPDSLFRNGFSPDGQNETCATYNLLKLSRQLFQYDPKGEYMDYYEQALYNHILASVAESDPGNTYHVPLNPGARKRFGNARMSGFTCCNGTALESNTKLQDSIYFRSADNRTLYVNLFVPSTLHWDERDVVVTQVTSFPYSDHTKLTIDGDGEFAVLIRWPRWARNGIHVSINGERLPVEAAPGEYFALQRTWNRGDTIDVRLPMSFRLSRIMDQPNIASIFYGPVLLAVEESAPLSDWRQIEIKTDDLSQSIEGDPGKLRFRIGDLRLKPFFETYDRYSVYLDVVPE